MQLQILEDPTPPRIARLRELEKIVLRGNEAIIKSANALAAIRDEGLWRDDGYESFDDFCRQRLGYQGNYVLAIFRCAEIINLAENAKNSGFDRDLLPPRNPFQSRQFAKANDSQKIGAMAIAAELHKEGVAADHHLFRRSIAAVKSPWHDFELGQDVEVLDPRSPHHGKKGVLESQSKAIAYVRFDGDSKATPLPFHELMTVEQAQLLPLIELPVRSPKVKPPSEFELLEVSSDIVSARLEAFEAIAEKLILAYDNDGDIAPFVEEFRQMTGVNLS